MLAVQMITIRMIITLKMSSSHDFHDVSCLKPKCLVQTSHFSHGFRRFPNLFHSFSKIVATSTAANSPPSLWLLQQILKVLVSGGGAPGPQRLICLDQTWGTIWVNWNILLTSHNKAMISDDFPLPLLSIIPVRENSEVVIIYLEQCFITIWLK